jgi:hypothetical protein
MKILVLLNLSLVVLICCSEAFAQPPRSYSVDPGECVSKLEWNSDFTRAKCKMRKGPISDGHGFDSVNFVFPIVEGWPKVKVGIRSLRNGYVLRLSAEEPVSPDQLRPLLAWALRTAVPQGIARPEGFCARFLSEVRAVF